jgi:transcriptional regulator with XRE-family HTH domain
MDPVQLIRDALKGKTQQELAREINCTQSHLSDFLNGRRGPGPRILDYLGLEVTYKRVVREYGKRGRNGA